MRARKIKSCFSKNSLKAEPAPRGVGRSSASDWSHAGRPLTLLTVVLTLALLATAQVDTGVLSGAVYDTSQAPVPQAIVTLLNVGTNYRLELRTNSAGLYVSPPLPPGTYRIQVSAPGFQTQAKETELHLSERLAVDFTLAVSAVTENVTVTELTSLLQTETATLSTRRASYEVTEIPNIRRSFTELMRFSAGVTPGQAQTTEVPISATRGNTSTSVNGVTFADNNFLIDGIQNNGGHQGWGVMNFPELDAIEEYRVETSVPDARFGRSGGTLNIGYRSGSNTFHGSLFEFLQNNRLNARNFFQTGPNAAFRRNQFGGTFGGPIGGKSAKTHFFVSYEGLRNRQGITSLSTVPTPLMKTGNFSEMLARTPAVTIYDPLTTVPNAAGQLTRTPFAGNIIPPNRFNPAGKNVLNLYPDPNQSGLTNNLLIAPGQSDDRDQYTIKVDRELLRGSRGFIRFTQGRVDKVDSFNNRLDPISTPYTGTRAPIIQGVVSYTHILSPVMINQARVGVSRHNLASISLNGDRNTANEVGIPNINVDPFTTGLPSIGVTGYPALGDVSATPAIIATTNWQFSDNFELIRGNHSMRFGMDMIRRGDNVFQVIPARGSFSFTTIYTNNPVQPANTGLGPAELLLGKPQSITLNYMTGARGLRRTDWAWYFQDDWKLAPKLTMNLGLRYELEQDYPNYEVNRRFSQFDLETGQTVPVGQGEFPYRSGIKNDLNNLAPRVGLAYRLSDKTVIRAGYGIFYSLETFAFFGQSLGAQPPYIINTTVANNQADFAGARSLTDGPLRTADPNAPGQNRLGISPNFRIPYVQQWNLAIQQQAPLGMQATVAYVGTKATRLPQRPNINQAVPGDGAVNLRRRWPQHAGVFYYETRVNAVYHSLQTSLVKRLSRGLHYQLSYTYSHLIDEKSRNVEPIPITNLSLQRGNGDWDIRHNMRTTFGYELPFGRGKKLSGGVNHIVDGIMGGWEVVGALSLYSGLPFSVFAATNTLNIGEGSYADRLRDGTLPSGERTLQRWFDVAAFANPGFRLWGNAGRNILFGPGTKQLDFSIFKNFKIHEHKTLQFRAEFFNFTNSPQFNNPNAGLGSPATGSIQTAGSEATAQRTQRLVQLALKFAF